MFLRYQEIIRTHEVLRIWIEHFHALSHAAMDVPLGIGELTASKVLLKESATCTCSDSFDRDRAKVSTVDVLRINVYTYINVYIYIYI